MQIRIDQQSGLIGVNQERARLFLEQNPGNLSVDYQPFEIELQHKDPAVKVDLTRVFYDMGLKGSTTFARDQVRNGHGIALEGIARRVQEGDRLAKIEGGNQAIPAIAHENFNQAGLVETNIAAIPKAPPQITVEEGSLEVAGVRGGWRISYNPSPVKLAATGYKTDVYLLRKPSITIQAVGDNVDIQG